MSRGSRLKMNLRDLLPFDSLELTHRFRTSALYLMQSILTPSGWMVLISIGKKSILSLFSSTTTGRLPIPGVSSVPIIPCSNFCSGDIPSSEWTLLWYAPQIKSSNHFSRSAILMVALPSESYSPFWAGLENVLPGRAWISCRRVPSKRSTYAP